MWRGWDGGWGEQGTGRTGSITAEYPDPSEGRLVHSQAGKKAHGETTPWLRAAWAKYNRHHPPLIINNPSCILRDDRSSIELGNGRFSKRKRGRGDCVTNYICVSTYFTQQPSSLLPSIRHREPRPSIIADRRDISSAFEAAFASTTPRSRTSQIRLLPILGRERERERSIR